MLVGQLDVLFHELPVYNLGLLITLSCLTFSCQFVKALLYRHINLGPYNLLFYVLEIFFQIVICFIWFGVLAFV